MVKVAKPSLPKRLKDLVLGKAIDPSNRQAFHSISLVAFIAWVGLGSDGLSSSAYGPEEAFLALGSHTHLAILIAIASAFTVLVISASYSQLIEIFPSGGGGYLVASKLISPNAGMVSGCALIIDYVLTITISIASASDAVFSFLPPHYQAYKLKFSLLVLVLIALMNMRGAKESVMPLVPVFMVFIFTHGFAIIYGLGTHLFDFPTVAHETATQVARTHSELGWFGMIFLILKAFSMGAGTYTGIEAVSNGLSILREPKVKTGKRTMLYMAISLAFTVFGLTLVYLLFKVEHQAGKTLNAVLFETMSANWPGKYGSTFVYASLISEALILFAAAQAGFLGGPRVIANMALDKWFPTRFGLLSDRLVAQNGIAIMSLAAMVTMIMTKGSVQYLVVLYSITVFVTFVLSQLGMVKYWLRHRTTLAHWRRKLAVNALGLGLCSFILVAVTILKFLQGGWITLLITGALIGMALAFKKHYNYVEKVLKRMDNLVTIAKSKENTTLPRLMGGHEGVPAPEVDPKAKTAVLMVNGFNGVGLHSLLAIIRMFGGIYKNYIFVEVGIVDAGTFKGVEEIDGLRGHVKSQLDDYVAFMNRNGYYAEGMMTLSHDLIDGCDELADRVVERFPQAVFFMGQLVFPEETFFSRLLHNNTVFAVQRRLYHRGVPFIILPIRINLKAK